MSLEFFAETRFQARTLAVIKQAITILADYAEQGFTLTLRQLFYQFVARDLLANTVPTYKSLGNTVRDARRAGLIDWALIEDRTRDLETFSTWHSPANILASAAESYREDIWLSQSFRVEVWVEKSALISVVEPACRRWRAPHMAARGYPSHSELYAAGKRMASHVHLGLRPVVFYLGDHDPSGLDMRRSLATEISLYASSPIEVVRLGLNLAQIRELNLPPNPAKETDRQWRAYVNDTGCTESWELDALSPTYIDGLIDHAIAGIVDKAAWDRALADEQDNRAQLEQLAHSHGGAR